MPTLEERLEVLERALSAMKLEHIYDVRQLDERISALHEQIAEQRKRLSEQERAIGRLEQTIDAKFDGLMKVLVQHSNALNARMDAQDKSLHQHFAAIDARFTAVDQHFAAIDQNFAAVGQNFAAIDQNFAAVGQNFASIDARFTRLEDQINQQTVEIKARFETSDLYATRTWGVVQSQEQNIREVKEHLSQLVTLLTEKSEE